MSLKKTLFFFFSFFACLSERAYGQNTLNVKPAQNQVLNCPEVRSRVNQIKDLKTQMGNKIESKNCDLLFDIHKNLIIKVHKRKEKAKKILAQSFNFSKPELMETSKLNWARNEQELQLIEALTITGDSIKLTHNSVQRNIKNDSY